MIALSIYRIWLGIMPADVADVVLCVLPTPRAILLLSADKRPSPINKTSKAYYLHAYIYCCLFSTIASRRIHPRWRKEILLGVAHAHKQLDELNASRVGGPGIDKRLGTWAKLRRKPVLGTSKCNRHACISTILEPRLPKLKGQKDLGAFACCHEDMPDKNQATAKPAPV